MPPIGLAFVPLVLRVADRMGFSVMLSGGLAMTVQRSFRVLNLYNILSADDRAALEASRPQLTLIARPTPGDDAPVPPPEDDHTFVVTGIERVHLHVHRLAGILARGLLVSLPQGS